MHPEAAKTGAPRVPLWLITLVLVGLSVLAALQTYRSGDADERVRFARRSERVLETLSFRLRSYVNALVEARGLFMATGQPDQASFFRFVENLEVPVRYPGLQGMGYAEKVPASERASWEARQRALLPEYRIWGPEGVEGTLAPISLIEPLDWRNRTALGFNMLSEARRAAAVNRATDTGQPAATESLQLVTETDVDPQKGFVLYVPVYRKGLRTSTPEARRDAVVGWLFSPFRVRDLFGHMLGERRLREVSVQIYDGPAVDPGRLLYDSGSAHKPTASHPRAPLRLQAPIEVGGQTWTLVMLETIEGGIDATYEALAVLIACLVISVLIVRATQVAQAHARVQRELLAKEQAAHQLAQRAVRSREDVLAVVSHDLRNPLNAAQLSAQVLSRVADNPLLPEAERKSARRATVSLLRSTERMRLLLGDLVDLARLDSGGLSVETAPHEVAKLVEDAVELQQPLAEQRGLKMTSRVAPALPLILCDRARVLQILANLIGNAIKFTASGGTIEVEARRIESGDGRLVEVAVRDNGRGISAEDLRRVFDRYFQATSSEKNGVGLGLFIARSLVEAQGGHIEAESEPGRGSTFRFTLPSAAEPARPNEVPAAT